MKGSQAILALTCFGGVAFAGSLLQGSFAGPSAISTFASVMLGAKGVDGGSQGPVTEKLLSKTTLSALAARSAPQKGLERH
jgi:hypothetical protein